MEIDAYLILKVLGISIFIFWGAFCIARAGFPFFKAFLITSMAALGAFATSRAWYIVQHGFGSEPYSPPDWNAAWNDAGSVLYGWILGGLAVVWFFSKLWKWPLYQVTDKLVPSVLIAQILNRFGCFSAGCCYGKPGHPVQLYEAAWDFLVFLLVWNQRNKPEGRVSFLYIVGYAVGRFFIEFYRGDNGPAALGLTVPQITSLILIVCAIILLQKHKKGSSNVRPF